MGENPLNRNGGLPEKVDDIVSSCRKLQAVLNDGIGVANLYEGKG
ncbi:hypothetical protein [Bacillus pacificus]